MRPIVAVAALLTVCCSALLRAESAPNPKLAITNIHEVDADFAFQGEYVGWSQFANTSQFQGLQVVALGDGEFLAKAYDGGLPGYGWNGATPAEFRGQREANVLTLKANRLAIKVSPSQATVIRDERYTLARLNRIVRVSPTMGAQPPHGAVVLFDGTPGPLKNAKVTEDGLLMVGTQTVDGHRDFSLHVEFRLPYMPYARGQGRSNSGVYLQSRYEVQILDSFGLEGEFNECGALYRYRKPDLNMCLPPLAWQTYDIDFRSPRFAEDGTKSANGTLMVRHNGVVIHDAIELERKTGAGKPEGAELLPTRFQDHGNPVHFRNMWLYEHQEAQCTTVVAPCDRRTWRKMKRRMRRSCRR